MINACFQDHYCINNLQQISCLWVELLNSNLAGGQRVMEVTRDVWKAFIQNSCSNAVARTSLGPVLTWGTVGCQPEPADIWSCCELLSYFTTWAVERAFVLYASKWCIMMPDCTMSWRAICCSTSGSKMSLVSQGGTNQQRTWKWYNIFLTFLPYIPSKCSDQGNLCWKHC